MRVCGHNYAVEDGKLHIRNGSILGRNEETKNLRSMRYECKGQKWCQLGTGKMLLVIKDNVAILLADRCTWGVTQVSSEVGRSKVARLPVSRLGVLKSYIQSVNMIQGCLHAALSRVCRPALTVARAENVKLAISK